MSKLFFILVHLAALTVIWTGFSWTALILCFVCYFVRMFAITGGYHRLFSHRSYKTSRLFQFVMGFLGATAAQKGPLWWAASHRHHHRYSDTEEDLHSPGLRGFWWAHVGWVLSTDHDEADLELVKDLSKYPELTWLDKYFFAPPLMFLGLMIGLGFVLAQFPVFNTTAGQVISWGAFMSTVLLYHGTFCINSLAHILGRRRYETEDSSKNSFILSIITLGEGWHNNHHRYPTSERQGFFWWELDVTHYILKALSAVGIVWDLKTPPSSAYALDSSGH